jgi:hypothetical protein
MCQHVANIDFAAIEMNRGDETVLVARDIEYSETVDQIGCWKSMAEGGKVFERRSSHDLKPAGQRCFAIGVVFPELLERLP